MDVTGLTQWGSSWLRERVCERGGFEKIMEICGKKGTVRSVISGIGIVPLPILRRKSRSFRWWTAEGKGAKKIQYWRDGAQHTAPLQEGSGSGFNLVGGGVPRDGGSAEIGFVGHVAGQRGVVAEDGVFGDLLVVAHPLEKSPQVRFFLVPGDAAISEPFGDRFFAGLGVMILVPFLEIGIAHGVWVAVGVIARGLVFAGLREISDRGFRDFENAL